MPISIDCALKEKKSRISFFFLFLLLWNNIKHVKLKKSNIISNLMARTLLTVVSNWISLITDEGKCFFFMCLLANRHCTGFWFSVVENHQYQIPRQGKEGQRLWWCTLLQVTLSSLQASVNTVGMRVFPMWETLCWSGDMTGKNAGKPLDWRWKGDGKKSQHLWEEIWASKQPEEINLRKLAHVCAMLGWVRN